MNSTNTPSSPSSHFSDPEPFNLWNHAFLLAGIQVLAALICGMIAQFFALVAVFIGAYFYGRYALAKPQPPPEPLLVTLTFRATFIDFVFNLLITILFLKYTHLLEDPQFREIFEGTKQQLLHSSPASTVFSIFVFVIVLVFAVGIHFAITFFGLRTGLRRSKTL